MDYQITAYLVVIYVEKEFSFFLKDIYTIEPSILFLNFRFIARVKQHGIIY